MTDTEPEPMLTTGEALKELRARGLPISERTFIRWGTERRIAFETSPTGRRLYRRDAIDALLAPAPETPDVA